MEDLLKLLATEDKSQEVTEEGNVSISGAPSELKVSYWKGIVEKQREEIGGLKQDRQQRKIFGYCIFGFLCLYMMSVIVVVFLYGFGMMYLSDTVLVTLLTTTLVEVIGIFNFVVKHLFPQGRTKEK